ncbi:MAG: BCCT family transporter [Eubacteriales bacterium]
MENRKTSTQNKSVDLVVTIPAVALVLFFAFMIFSYRDAMDKFLTDTFYLVTNGFGSLLLFLHVITFIMCIWLVLGKYAKKKFGEEAPDLSNFSFYSLIFTFGSSASIIYWVFIEFYYYLEGPPFGVEPFTVEALKWGSAYPVFHWGIFLFSAYAIVGVAFAFFIHVKKKNTSRVSAACECLIGEKHANGLVGRIIDGFFLFTIIVSTAGYSLGVSIPIVGTFFENTFGIDHTLSVDTGIIVAVTTCCALAMYTGLNKGMSFICNARIILFFAVAAFVFIVGDKAFMLNNILESTGWQAQHFIQMATQTDAVGGSGWPQSWTVFYALFFLAAIVSAGLYYAKLCKGRTVRECVIAIVVASSVGCAIFFWTMGNYSITTYLGDPETFKAMMAQNPYDAIAYVISTLPLAKGVMAALLVYAFVSTWTFAQSAIYTMAMVSQPNLGESDDPSKIGRIGWCVITGILTIAFLYIGGLQTVKNSMVWAGIPSAIVAVMVVISNFKDMKKVWGDKID